MRYNLNCLGREKEERGIFMKVMIQVSAADDAKAWAMMMRHSPGIALPNRTFIVSEESARALREAGIRFTELSRGVMSGLKCLDEQPKRIRV